MIQRRKHKGALDSFAGSLRNLFARRERPQGIPTRSKILPLKLTKMVVASIKSLSCRDHRREDFSGSMMERTLILQNNWLRVR
jgi:hypothetical protein